jgi:hypothetical protein
VHPKSHMSSCRLSWKLTGTTLDIRILEVHDANKPWKLLESRQNDLTTIPNISSHSSLFLPL